MVPTAIQDSTRESVRDQHALLAVAGSAPLLNRRDDIVVGPVSELPFYHFVSGVYQLKGTDTLSWGPPDEWIEDKAAFAWLYRQIDFLVDESDATSLGAFPDQDVTGFRVSAKQITSRYHFVDIAFAALELAAQSEDEGLFSETVRQISWTGRPASDFLRAVQMALGAGAHLAARRLASEGAKLYPNHQELSKIANLLAPPRIIESKPPSDSSISDNQAWLRSHTDEYRGWWVALYDGNLVAAAETVSDLKSRLDTTSGLMITKVI
jgi:hypothetical protein